MEYQKGDKVTLSTYKYIAAKLNVAQAQTVITYHGPDTLWQAPLCSHRRLDSQ